MNERVPDSSGLPLRAMVMVLLFLGVVFLLLVWQALGSSPNSEDDSSAISTMTTTTAAPTSTSVKPAAPRAEVRVYNISGTEGAPRGRPIGSRRPVSRSPTLGIYRYPTSRRPRCTTPKSKANGPPPTR